MKKSLKLIALLLALIFSLFGCSLLPEEPLDDEPSYEPTPLAAYEVRNGNVPYFTDEELTNVSFESYSPLDSYGRCGTATACIGIDIMPKEDEKRGSISSVTPSGWVQASYDTSIVENGYLYNRAHLIGWQLTAENANERNLITGTRYMNTEGMLPFENMVASYIKETENHVMYRVTPEYKGKNPVASGVLMEAISVEDGGEGICFCVYVFNYQPGIIIDYATGKSTLGETTEPPEATPDTDDGGTTPETMTYILNTSSKRFHKQTCSGVTDMKEENKQVYTGTRDDLIDEGYTPCGICKP